MQRIKIIQNFILLTLVLFLVFAIGNYSLGDCSVVKNLTTSNGKTASLQNTIINDKKRNTLNDLQKAVIVTADAYWRRGVDLQYEPRLKYYCNPEEATKDNTQYGTCNTFTYDVYKEALGITTPLSSVSAVAFYNEPSKYTILALDGDDYRKCIEKGLTNTILQKMEPGDIILYRHHNNNDGHAQMVYSLVHDERDNIVDAWLIHGNTAGIKNHAMERRISRYDSKQIEGSIQKIRFSDFYKSFQELDSTKPRYISYFVLLRPFLDGKTWLAWDNYTIDDEKKAKRKTTNGNVVYGKDKNGNEIRRGMRKPGTEREEMIQVTEAAKDRMQYPDIYISKISNYNNKTVVPINGEVLYTVSIKNFSKNNYSKLKITEKVPVNASYIAGGDRLENNTVIWENITIPAGETREFTYRVKTPSVIGAALTAEGKVNNIKTTPVKNICGHVFANSDIEKIRNCFYKLQANSLNMGFAFVNEVYMDAFGVDLGLSYLTTKDILDDSNTVIGLKNMETLMHNDNNYDYARYEKYYYDYKELIKLYNTQRIKEVNMHPGEIILSSKDNINYAYIYLGNEIVGKNASGVVSFKSEEEKDKFLKDLYFADEVRDVDGKYIERNKFKVKNIVISPANVID